MFVTLLPVLGALCGLGRSLAFRARNANCLKVGFVISAAISERNNVVEYPALDVQFLGAAGAFSILLEEGLGSKLALCFSWRWRRPCGHFTALPHSLAMNRTT